MHLTTTILSALLAIGAPLAAADAHAGHDHAGHDHGTGAAVGTVVVGAHTVVASASGAPVAGAEWHVELALTPADKVSKAVRVWVGVETGRGSAKAKAAKDDAGDYAAHVEVPNPLPADARLWIAIDGDAPAAGSLALPTKR